MPRDLVFDLGGVLLRWRPHEFMPRLLPHAARDAAETAALIDRFFEGFRGDWGDFDRGTIEPAPLAERIARRTGLGLDEVRTTIDAVPLELAALPDSVALLRRLHAAGHRLYFLSNMPAPYADHLRATHDFFDLFAGGVFSAHVRLIKPEPEIFAHAERALGLDPSRTLFFDDVARNVSAARAAGWRAEQFVDAAGCAADLARLGVAID